MNFQQLLQIVIIYYGNGCEINIFYLCDLINTYIGVYEFCAKIIIQVLKLRKWRFHNRADLLEIR